jgi:hypothetical protein
MFDASAIHRREAVKSVDTPMMQPFDCNVTDFNVRQDEGNPKEEEGCEIPIPLKAKLYFESPTLDGNFKIMQLDDTAVQKVKIGEIFLVPMEEGHIKCLKGNADLFACSTKEMPGIEPSVACHKLKVNPSAEYIS